MTRTRRDLLVATAGALMAPRLAGAFPLPPGSPLTPAQMEGPFYPDSWERISVSLWEGDNDLCRREGRPTPDGRQLYLLGRVVRPNGQPVSNARVELWNAANNGHYLLEWPSGDGPTSTRDPAFQHFGACATGADGSWAFRTIIPPSYPADLTETWIRPPHLHLKVLVRGWERLTTQLYFDDPVDPDNAAKHAAIQAKDRLFVAVREEHRGRLVVPLEPLPVESPALATELATHGLTVDPASVEGPWGRARLGRRDLCIPASGGMKPPRTTPVR